MTTNYRRMGSGATRVRRDSDTPFASLLHTRKYPEVLRTDV